MMAVLPAQDPQLAAAYNSFVSATLSEGQPTAQSSGPPAGAGPTRGSPRAASRSEELGMVGGILPTPGLQRAYGDPSFDPLFAEAERLGVILAVHGASRAVWDSTCGRIHVSLAAKELILRDNVKALYRL